MYVSQQLKDKIKRLPNLPTLSEVAAQLVVRLKDPHISVTEISELIGQDPSMTAKILRIANSAFYGMPRSISKIKEAIVLLGLKAIHTVALSITVFDLFSDHTCHAAFDRIAFWRHNIICALLSKNIASEMKTSQIHPEIAFCIGLLHDIGKIVMEQYLHEDMHRTLDYSLKTHHSFFDSEKKVLQYTHSDIATLLISQWNLPDELFYPIVHHHQPLFILNSNASIQCTKPVKTYTAIIHIVDYYYYYYYSTIFAEKKSNGHPISPPPHFSDTESFLGITDIVIEEKIQKILPEELKKMSLYFELLNIEKR